MVEPSLETSSDTRLLFNPRHTAFRTEKMKGIAQPPHKGWFSLQIGKQSGEAASAKQLYHQGERIL